MQPDQNLITSLTYNFMWVYSNRGDGQEYYLHMYFYAGYLPRGLWLLSGHMHIVSPLKNNVNYNNNFLKAYIQYNGACHLFMAEKEVGTATIVSKLVQHIYEIPHQDLCELLLYIYKDYYTMNISKFKLY